MTLKLLVYISFYECHEYVTIQLHISYINLPGYVGKFSGSCSRAKYINSIHIRSGSLINFRSGEANMTHSKVILS